MSHANAPLTPTGRLRLARCLVEDGWTRLQLCPIEWCNSVAEIVSNARVVDGCRAATA